MVATGTRPFGVRLAEARSALGPLCVGIDPASEALGAWGLPDSPAGLESYVKVMLEAAAGTVAIVKPQAAFFERHGADGIRVLEQLCDLARQAGLLVLLDAKRGDIGTTNEAYADAYLSSTGPFAVDALTVTAYTGFGALAPLVDGALAEGAGLFVLVRTSNREGELLQQAITRDGPSVAEELLRGAGAANAAAGHTPGSIGIVFGATVDTEGYALDELGAHVLAPGLGAQGASVDDVARRFRRCPDAVVPTASRSISAAGPDRARLAKAIRTLNDACAQGLV